MNSTFQPEKMRTIEEVLKNKTQKLVCGKYEFIKSQNSYGYVLHGKKIYPILDISPEEDEAIEENDLKYIAYQAVKHNVVGVLLKFKSKNVVLINGDDVDEYNSLIDDISEMPIISFDCLKMFYPNKKAMSLLCNEKIKILDYTCDEKIPLTQDERDRLNLDRSFQSDRQEAVTLKRPKPGFSIVGGNWHRSGTVLLHDEENDIYILQGQDEGTYFGVELPNKVSTVNEAFNALIPKEAKGKKFRRQGEWFMVPVHEKHVPKIEDCIACSFDRINLPIEDAYSNIHEIYSSDIRIDKHGTIYAFAPSVCHNEHQSITSAVWNVFYKNTALRSFSAEGVD